ncbi:hypothetical protein BC826DRAFT_1005997, partial [Russula brevipes]
TCYCARLKATHALLSDLWALAPSLLLVGHVSLFFPADFLHLKANLDARLVVPRTPNTGTACNQVSFWVHFGQSNYEYAFP